MFKCKKCKEDFNANYKANYCGNCILPTEGEGLMELKKVRRILDLHIKNLEKEERDKYYTKGESNDI